MKQPAEEAGRPAPTVKAKPGAAVSIVGVEKSYGPVTALHPTTFEIGSGEFFAIIGPSGSGKSTLLGAIAGFIAPSAGQILVNDVDLLGHPPYDRNIGMVFQNYSLFPHMTVGENISFPLKMRRMPKVEIAARVKRILEMVRLSDFADRRPVQLSGGQQQRVALARAAVYDPLLLLMDEPLGALDKNLREEMQEEIKRFQSAIGATVVYVTHDQHEAASMADRIAIMNAGRFVQIGTPRQLYEAPRNVFVASFLGESNILPVSSIARDEGEICLARTRDGLTIRAAAPERPAGGVALSIRPENVEIDTAGAGAENRMKGEVVDAVYTAGTVRYRVKIGSETTLIVRVPSRHGIRLLEPGEMVRVAWKASDTLVVTES
ncbi:MAG: ABC transporter ATP-binding protein [Parvibaculaceae bacterium]